MKSGKIDRSKARFRRQGFAFTPLRPRRGVALAEAGAPGDADLLVFEVGGERRALLLREMNYHHVAQGEVRGEPFLVSF